MNSSRKPIAVNEGFKCEKCGKKNEKTEHSYRNHCRFCLYSKHVDDIAPGDRMSTCNGLMEPIGVKYHTQKGWQIIQKCLRCGKEYMNIVAEDDNKDLVNELMRRQNINNV